MKSRVYLDWNATAPMRPEAVAAMTAAAEVWANPSSVHSEGRRGKGQLEDARESVAAALGAEPVQIVFTSGGTEALALALHGASAKRLLVSAAEHSAVLEAVPQALRLPVDAAGILDLQALEQALAGQPALVALMHANNENGVIQPVAEAYELVQAAGGRLLVDAVQTAGKLPLPPGDFLALSAHKLGGPPGIGALVVRCAGDLRSVQKGGGQERGLRGGTENVPGAAGFAAALQAAEPCWLEGARRRRDRMEARLKAVGAEIIAEQAERLPNTSMIRMPGCERGRAADVARSSGLRGLKRRRLFLRQGRHEPCPRSHGDGCRRRRGGNPGFYRLEHDRCGSGRLL